MKKNPYDRVEAKIVARIESVSDKIAIRYHNVKPFAKEVIPEKELIESYKTFTPEDIEYGISKYGEKVVNDFLGEMQQKLWRKENA